MASPGKFEFACSKIKLVSLRRKARSMFLLASIASSMRELRKTSLLAMQSFNKMSSELRERKFLNLMTCAIVFKVALGNLQTTLTHRSGDPPVLDVFIWLRPSKLFTAELVPERIVGI